MSYARRLIDAMTDGGSVLRPGDGDHEYVVVTHRGRVLSQPCRLTLDPGAVQRYVEGIAEDSAAVFPEVAPGEAGYRLMTIHLDETIDGVRPVRQVWFDDDEIRSTPLEDWVDPLDSLPPGDYRWSVTRPEA